ncbi:ras-related GTP-binding protein B isoform X2 [Balaenoptera acutorostrata]|uniref:Ras-related GTP-binding protein n=1 Tax=Balaenoptera acutorostrata TaxID=9767 RepID=A0ABM3SXH2_BALAC|nr:ras-related GTP-binding protein B isoform X2 [Balaenoptera acutorostrata]
MEESDSEKKMEKENLGTRMDPPIGEPEGSLGWVLPNTAMKKKVLLMGKSGSGKTSMRSIIFANYIARDTRRLGATILDRLHSLQINSSLSTYSLVDSVGNTKTFDVEHSHVRFLGNLVLNLWDCGGQDTFMENYFTSQRDNIFRNVEVLIYVFDVESRELEKDMHYYQSCLEAILQNSPDAKIFCLVHKMDLVQEDQRDLIFKEREEDLRRLSRPLECSCFRTSIWDETLYKAWSSIVYQLIPNVQQLEMNLRNFAEIIEADEVLLFERATFLLLTWKRCNGQLSDVAKSSDGEVKGQRAHRQGSLPWKFTTLSPVFPASGNSNKQVSSSVYLETRGMVESCFSSILLPHLPHMIIEVNLI